MRFKLIIILFLGWSSSSLQGQHDVKWTDGGSGFLTKELIQVGSYYIAIKEALMFQLQIEKYTNVPKYIKGKKVKLRYDAKKVRFIKAVERNGKLFLILKMTDKKKGIWLFADELNLATLEPTIHKEE